MQHKISITSLSDLPIAARQLLDLFPDKRVFALFGEMGAGKTTFITAICKKLGVIDRISSPSFSIVNEYKSARGLTIFHFDFYRIKDLSEVYDLGYEDYFYSNAYCFIEWSERIEELLPDDYVKVEVVKIGEERELNIQ